MKTRGGEQRGCTRDTAEMAIGHLLCQWEPWVLKMQLSMQLTKGKEHKENVAFKPTWTCCLCARLLGSPCCKKGDSGDKAH